MKISRGAGAQVVQATAHTKASGLELLLLVPGCFLPPSRKWLGGVLLIVLKLDGLVQVLRLWYVCARMAARGERHVLAPLNQACKQLVGHIASTLHVYFSFSDTQEARRNQEAHGSRAALTPQHAPARGEFRRDGPGDFISVLTSRNTAKHFHSFIRSVTTQFW